VWSDRPARILGLIGLFLGIVLFGLVSLAVSSRTTVSLLLGPSGPLDMVPAVRLFLLPVLAAAFYTADLLGGLFFYRQEDRKPLAYVLWSSGLLTILLFLFALYFIVKAA
jgi:hypothetical protein